MASAVGAVAFDALAAFRALGGASVVVGDVVVFGFFAAFAALGAGAARFGAPAVSAGAPAVPAGSSVGSCFMFLASTSFASRICFEPAATLSADSGASAVPVAFFPCRFDMTVSVERLAFKYRAANLSQVWQMLGLSK